MKKIISFVGLFAVLGVGIGDAHGVAMSAQVRRLLQEKQEKIEQLEKCEGKKQGWMIAGISTIGLTAVGVGVNIAQASKSNRLSDEIEMEKSTLERHQNELNRIQNDIATERAKQAQNGGGNGQSGGGNGGSSVSVPVPEGSNIIGKLCGEDDDERYANIGTWVSCGNESWCHSECYVSGESQPVACGCVQTACLNEMGKLGDYYRIVDDEDEPIPFVNVVCDGMEPYGLSPEVVSVLSSHATNLDGHFCLEEDIPDGANCSITCIGYNPMAGTMGELKDALKKNNNKLIMCSSAINLKETYKFGESCENSSNNPNTSQSGGDGKRVVGGDCIQEDLKSLHAISGHYITTGVKTKKCASSVGAALPNENNCSCAAQECDTQNGYEMVKGQGWCRKVKS
jgi:hypothetical protein